jgi:pimeloyl-ACP methyl ester carboxylesterase
MSGPFPDAPSPDAPTRLVPSTDGTTIAVFSAGDGAAGDGAGAASGAPVLLVHGTGSDHTTWRAVVPFLAGRPVHAPDRRGRGASGDGPDPYAAGHEADDIAAVAQVLASRHGVPITVAGHSLGGRLALAAALRTDAIGRVLAYESAPGARGDPDARGHAALLARLRGDLERGDHDAVLATFLREAGGLPETELAAFRATDLWPVRAATAPLIVRELDAALHDETIGMDALAMVAQPVIQLTGSSSPGRFRDDAVALHERLAAGRLETIDGARHNAHHTHPGAFAAVLRRVADGR